MKMRKVLDRGGATPGAPGQMTWLEDPAPWLKPWLRPAYRPAYCFASVTVWTENKNVTISHRFICFILTVKRRWRPVFWGRQLKKGRQLFREQKCIRVTWLEDFLTSSDLATLLRWHRHWFQSGNGTAWSHIMVVLPPTSFKLFQRNSCCSFVLVWTEATVFCCCSDW